MRIIFIGILICISLFSCSIKRQKGESSDFVLKTNDYNIDYFPNGKIRSIYRLAKCPCLTVKYQDKDYSLFDTIVLSSGSNYILDLWPDSVIMPSGQFIDYNEDEKLSITGIYKCGYISELSEESTGIDFTFVPIRNGVWVYFDTFGKLEVAYYYDVNGNLTDSLIKSQR
jgi:hypothetical protein